MATLFAPVPMGAGAATAATAAALVNLGVPVDGAGAPVPSQPSGPHLGAPGTPAAAGCESAMMRRAFRAGALPGLFRLEGIDVAVFNAYVAPADHAARCAAHNGGVAGVVCEHRTGLYLPMCVCVLCACLQCWAGGGGQPFGANNHSAANHLISILGYVLFANAIDGVRVLVDRGPGRVDVCILRGKRIVLVDLVSGSAGARNEHILETAKDAAAMGFVVTVIRAGLYEYTASDGTRVPRRMDATPAASWGILVRFLHLVLNLIIPMLTDADGMWQSVVIPAGFLAGGANELFIPVYLAWLHGFPFVDSAPTYWVGAVAGVVYPAGMARATDWWDAQRNVISGVLHALCVAGVHFQSRLLTAGLNTFAQAGDPVPLPLVNAAVMWPFAPAGARRWSECFAAWPLKPAPAFAHPDFPLQTYFIGNAAYAAAATAATGRAALVGLHHIEPPPAGTEAPFFGSRLFGRFVREPANMPAPPAPTAHVAAAAANAALVGVGVCQSSFL